MSKRRAREISWRIFFPKTNRYLGRLMLMWIRQRENQWRFAVSISHDYLNWLFVSFSFLYWTLSIKYNPFTWDHHSGSVAGENRPYDTAKVRADRYRKIEQINAVNRT